MPATTSLAIRSARGRILPACGATGRDVGGDIFRLGGVEALAAMLVRYAGALEKMGRRASSHLGRFSLPAAVEATVRAIKLS